MGYLDNSAVTIDAVLTLKGRELLAKGMSEFNITQFAVGDDEVDYSLWNTDHPLGSAYYGTIIENMPITEAVPDETQALKYKLITLPKGSTRIPVISVGSTSLTLNAAQSATVTPTTLNFASANTQLGYTAILSDSKVGTLTATEAPNPISPTTPRFIGDNEDSQSVSATGLTFTLTANTFTDADRTATLTIIGNETGGSVSISLTIKKTT
jgi:hypothetical protein